MRTPALSTRSRLRASLSALVAFLLLASSAAPVRADTYYNVDCKCDPKTEGIALPKLDASYQNFDAKNGCVCTENYTLPFLGTKEFRFRCKRHDTAWPMPVFQGVYNRDKPTTCTISWAAIDYGTVSCTNWSLLSTDVVKLQAICTTIEEGLLNDH